MSTVIDKAPVVAAPVRTGRHSAAAVLALARFEARELLVQIPVLVLFPLYIGFALWKLFSSGDGMDDYPVLQSIDRAHQSDVPFLAVALFMCANVAVLRPRRHGTDRHFDVLPLESWRRTVAHALSVVPFAGVTALVIAVQFGWAAVKPGAAGHGSVAELAVGPLLVLLAGVLGVLIARIYPSVVGGWLFVVVGFAALLVVSAVTEDKQHWLNWLHPIVSENGSDPIPADLLGRPAAWHALYLVGLIAVVLCAAVLLSGGRTRLLKALTVVALGATAAGIAGQSPSHEAALTAARTSVTRTPARFQSCVTHGRSTYCSFPEWTGWRDDWARVVDRVQGFAGGEAGGARMTIRQRIPVIYDLASDAALEPLHTLGEVTAGTRWGGNRVPEFAVGVASVLVAGDEQAVSGMCDARVVTIVWLALAAQDDPAAAFRDVRLDDGAMDSGVVLSPTDPVSMNVAQTRIVRELLKKPRYDVAARVKAHWAELTSPKTSEARTAELLGVPAAAGGVGDGASKETSSCEG